MLNLFQILRQALATAEPEPDPNDPFSHPAIAAMSPAELADLPLPHPPAPAPLPRGVRAPRHDQGTRTSFPLASRRAIRPIASAACASA